MSTAEIKAVLSGLDTNDKLEVIDFLWSQLYDSYENSDVSIAHREMVREEYDQYKKGNSKPQPWNDVKTEILSAIQNRGS